MTRMRDCEIFDTGNVVLQSGSVFSSLRPAYRTYGKLSPRKDVIVYQPSPVAQHYDTDRLARPGGLLDSDRFFIVIPNLFGLGLSSSPSNTPEFLGGAQFPAISYHDAVAVQRRLPARSSTQDSLSSVRFRRSTGTAPEIQSTIRRIAPFSTPGYRRS